MRIKRGRFVSYIKYYIAPHHLRPLPSNVPSPDDVKVTFVMLLNVIHSRTSPFELVGHESRSSENFKVPSICIVTLVKLLATTPPFK